MAGRDVKGSSRIEHHERAYRNAEEPLIVAPAQEPAMDVKGGSAVVRCGIELVGRKIAHAHVSALAKFKIETEECEFVRPGAIVRDQLALLEVPPDWY